MSQRLSTRESNHGLDIARDLHAIAKIPAFIKARPIRHV